MKKLLPLMLILAVGCSTKPPTEEKKPDERRKPPAKQFKLYENDYKGEKTIYARNGDDLELFLLDDVEGYKWHLREKPLGARFYHREEAKRTNDFADVVKYTSLSFRIYPTGKVICDYYRGDKVIRSFTVMIEEAKE